ARPAPRATERPASRSRSRDCARGCAPPLRAAAGSAARGRSRPLPRPPGASTEPRRARVPALRRSLSFPICARMIGNATYLASMPQLEPHETASATPARVRAGFLAVLASAACTMSGAADSDARSAARLARMTVDEKVAQLRTDLF